MCVWQFRASMVTCTGQMPLLASKFAHFNDEVTVVSTEFRNRKVLPATWKSSLFLAVTCWRILMVRDMSREYRYPWTCGRNSFFAESSRVILGQLYRPELEVWREECSFGTKSGTELQQKMSGYKFYYFPGRGRGEICRLALAAANLEFEDIRLAGEEWTKEKACK